MRILIVEDDVVLGMVAAAALANEGHGVVGPAFTPAEALALAESDKADKVDLALVDINLGGNDEGIVLARRLAQDFGIASIFVSGQVAVARDSRDAALGLLNKPYDLDDLIALVAAAPALAAGQGAPAGLPASFEFFHGHSGKGAS